MIIEIMFNILIDPKGDRIEYCEKITFKNKSQKLS